MGTAEDISTKLGCLSDDTVRTGEYPLLNNGNSVALGEDERMKMEGRISVSSCENIGGRR